jgi:hypothetical protein
MPTVGWIQETAHDRLYERGGGGLKSAPLAVQCPICNEAFSSTLSLSWHINELHPLPRPMLLVRGMAAAGALVIRTPLSASDVSVARTTAAYADINGKGRTELSPGDVGPTVSGIRDAVLRLELEHHRSADASSVRAYYEVRIAIPDAADLDAVDSLFIQHLAVDEPTTVELLAFKERAAAYSSADRYTDGLIDYVYGVLAKMDDARLGATIPYEAFQGKFMRALDELGEFETRPVARAACAVARLNINDLRNPGPPTGDPTLDTCFECFSRLAAGGKADAVVAPADVAAQFPLCPIDTGTHVVLQAFSQLFGETPPSGDTVSACAAIAEGTAMSAFDRTKLHALVAAELLVGHDAQRAQEHLQRLVHDPMFGSWAQHHFDQELA